ncbi:phage baseplate assembly protein V [Entomobacter blattae]|uniref:Bacteriophage Mu Gp45 protein n=1 Tax=Entomobacter blattae TaxID=2762277 RepID=A0A7H1NUJ2_9PROT|nr:phage baseplate assembly protein V [Entomobacter blattae]QNT79452.1 Bacteriophage Mu Gp45 protein [Entomobacter blattae]
MSLEKRLARRVSMSTSLGRLSADINQSKSTPTAQMVLGGSEVRSDIPFLQHYGFASLPLAGTDLHISFQSGDRTHGVVTASNDQRYRPQALKPGESCLYNHNGSMVLIQKDGTIYIKPSNGKVVIDAKDITITGDVTLKGKLSVSEEITGKEVEASGVKLTSHRHSNGNQGQPTGGPLS